MRVLVVVLLLITGLSPAFSPPQSAKTHIWVDEKMAAMSLDEKIAQLMMIEVRPRLGKSHLDNVRYLVRKHQLGGVIFFKGNPQTQISLTNELQSYVNTKLLVAIDGEWGLSMRLSNTIEYPYQMALGAINADTLLFQMGQHIGEQCKRMGIHVNFAPVADLNNNPKNPVINYRSFGEDKANTSKKALAYALGMQKEGVIACAKHFPGHGDTDTDSHKALPQINHSKQHLDSFELYPFRYMFDGGVMSVMTAHLNIPSLDNGTSRASSLSKAIVTDLLKKQYNYHGLIFTDALTMRGVADYFQPGELEVEALIAGNDVLLGPKDVPAAIKAIKTAISQGKLSIERIDESVRKILNAKEFAGLDQYQPIATAGLQDDLNKIEYTELKQKLVANSMLLINDPDNLLPLDALGDQSIASIAVGVSGKNNFQNQLEKHTNIDCYQVGKAISDYEAKQLKDRLSKYDRVIISFHNTSKYPKTYGAYNAISTLLNTFYNRSGSVLVHFGNPYLLTEAGPVPPTIFIGWVDDAMYHQAAANALFGEIKIDAKLPVTIRKAMPVGMGKSLGSNLEILEYGNYAAEGFNENLNTDLDFWGQKGVNMKATPGCQVLVAKNGKIVYYKSFGHHTYEEKNPVLNTDIYDLASLTKIFATTLSIMKLDEEGKLSLNDRLSEHLPDLKYTNKRNITVGQVLQHKAGLKAWIPFYSVLTKNATIYADAFSNVPTEKHTDPCGNRMYINPKYKTYVLQKIYDSPVNAPGRYLYSDLGMIMLKYVIENITKQPFEQYTYETFYGPMGLTTLTFLPAEKFPLSRIIPTEKSIDYRKGLIHGFVHDPGAAMLGGVSGHAGLFSNAADIAAVMQMWLNGGFYNGVKYLKASTIKKYIVQQNSNSRRGMGFDKPEFDTRKIEVASRLASKYCFGHSGFTGTQAWADPQYNLIYIYLSNRVHPTSENKRLIYENIRTELMDAIYKSMKST